MREEIRKIAIDYLKSSISVSTYVGCTNGCKYCIIGNIKRELRKIEKIQEESEAVENLFKYKYWVRNKSVISINNRTDPFINQEVSDSTLKILKILEKNSINNIIILITRMCIDSKVLKEIDELSLNIILFYSYSGLESPIESFSENYRKKSIEIISRYWVKHKKVHYIRPIIPGCNDYKKNIEHMLLISKRYFDACVISGIRLTNEISRNLVDNIVNKDIICDIPYSNHKYLSNDVIRGAREVAQDIKYNMLFFNTSCVISCLSQIPDYNCSFQNYKCSKSCPNYNLCERYFLSINYEKKINDLERMGISSVWSNKKLKICREVQQDELSYYTHLLGVKCVADIIRPSGSEAIIET